MKKHLIVAAAASVAIAGPAFAQEHYVEGPVWTCDMYQVNPAMYDKYMNYIRTNVVPQQVEAKKQGLILDWKTFERPRTGPDSWDYMACTLVKNFAALDYSKETEDKADAISAAVLKSADKQKQDEITKVRLEMRRYIGTVVMRETQLRPMK